MARPPRRLMVAAVVGLFALLPAQPAAAAGSGSVAGSLTRRARRCRVRPWRCCSTRTRSASSPASPARTAPSGCDGVPGTYKLKFSLLGGLEQFYPGRTDFASGVSITVADGQTTGVTDTVIAHGSLAGHAPGHGRAGGTRAGRHRPTGVGRPRTRADRRRRRLPAAVRGRRHLPGVRERGRARRAAAVGARPQTGGRRRPGRGRPRPTHHRRRGAPAPRDHLGPLRRRRRADRESRGRRVLAEQPRGERRHLGTGPTARSGCSCTPARTR